MDSRSWCVKFRCLTSLAAALASVVAMASCTGGSSDDLGIDPKVNDPCKAAPGFYAKALQDADRESDAAARRNLSAVLVLAYEDLDESIVPSATLDDLRIMVKAAKDVAERRLTESELTEALESYDKYQESIEQQCGNSTTTYRGSGG